MRSKLILSLALLLSFALLSCKKKKKEEEPAATSAPVTPAHMNSMTAKLNGTAWAMGSENGLSYDVSSRSSYFYYFGGQTSMNIPYTAIQLNFFPAVGSHTLAQFGNYSAKYYNGNISTYYTARTGTLNITELDTNSQYGLPKTFKCTFSFMTDTVAGVSYNVTEGVVDYKVN
jgi:hypothetical protein